jgi:putative tail protein
MSGGGKGKTQSQITGYKYFMAVHFGLGRGPLNSLKEIRVGDVLAWQGDQETSDYIHINQPNLFGGDQKEGGIVGDAKLMMGEPDQIVDDQVRSFFDGAFPMPGFRGVTTLGYYGQICSNNPYPKEWKFRVARTTAGWDTPVWQSDLATIDMQTAPLTFVTFNRQPKSGEGFRIGDGNPVLFVTLAMGHLGVVQIGADVEGTASACASMLNEQAASYNDVTASVSGTQVILQFPTPTSVTYYNSNFVTIGNQGGGITAMNPAHIIYECATNNVWGRGLPTSLIDEDSFFNAAQTLVEEQFGICIRWNRQEDIDKFVGTIVNHIGAAVYIDRQTGLLSLKLIRDDYDPNTLPPFTFQNGLLEITEDSASSADTTFNEIIVNYTDPLSGKKGQVRCHNIGSFRALGTLLSTTVDYLGIPTADLAMRLAQRDLQINSSDLRRLKIKVDRTGWYINPADVIKLHVPERGIDNMLVRVGQIEDGSLEDETITLTCVQDVFSLPATSFVKPQPSFWTPPDKTPRPIQERLVDEATYYDLAENLPPGELDSVATDNGLIKIYAEQPTSTTLDYIVSTKTSVEANFVDRTTAGFDAGADLVGDLALHGTDIGFSDITGPEAGLIADAGVNIPVLIVNPLNHAEQEYCRLVSIDTSARTATLARGTIDTIPHPFRSNSKIWFQTNVPTTDFRRLSSSEIADVKLLPRLANAQLDPTLADTDEVTIGARQGRPYPPGNLQIMGNPFDLSQVILPGTEIALTWAHRDRITQSSFLVDHTAADVGPEPGTTYTIELSDPATGTIFRTESSISGNSWTYLTGLDDTDGNPTAIHFKLYSVRDSLLSWQAYEFNVYRSSGFDEDFDYNFDGGT